MSSRRLVFGLQPVREAIRIHQNKLGPVWIERRDMPRLDRLARFATDNGARVERRPRSELDRESRNGQHQGVLTWAPELELVELTELLGTPDLLAVALDGIQDPQNFGAVIRSAVGLVGAAVLWGESGSAPLSPATFRASAGAVEHARLCRVPSLHQALTEARASGVQVIGLEPRSDRFLSDLDLRRPSLLVVGGEHEGIGRAVRRSCDELVGLLATHGVQSLNASVSAAIGLYEAHRQRSATRSDAERP